MICNASSLAELVKPGGFLGLLNFTHIMTDSLYPEIPYLIQAASAYLEHRYDTTISNYTFSRRKEGWQPSLVLSTSNDFLIFAEASNTIFPETFERYYTDIFDHSEPIAAYSICPEESWLDKKQKKAGEQLKSQGFGLITVNDQGVVSIRISASPLTLWISETDLKAALHGMDSKRIKNEIKQAFEDYKVRSQAGMAEISGLLQQIISKSILDGIKSNWFDQKVSGYSTLDCLQELSLSKNCRAIRYEIEDAREFYTKFRNPGNTEPKSRRAAQLQFREFRQGFLDGIRQITSYRVAMKSIGLSGNLGTRKNRG